MLLRIKSTDTESDMATQVGMKSPWEAYMHVQQSVLIISLFLHVLIFHNHIIMHTAISTPIHNHAETP